jgi:hypothetical protein
MTEEVIEETTEARGQELLRSVRAAVGLLIDASAIESNDSTGMSWIKAGRISKTPAPRVTSLRALLVCSGEARSPRHTGVLFRGGNNRLYIATSAHCITVEEKWREQVRLFVGMDQVGGKFSSRQVIRLGVVEHYEEIVERDLAILRGTAGGIVAALSLPVENLEIGVGDQIFVVGHAGGLDMAVFTGTVKSRVPQSPKRPLRSINVIVEGARPCLSGSPVFVWPKGADPILCGLLQGPKEVQVRERLARRLSAKLRGFAAGDENKAGRWLRLVERSLLYAELVVRHREASVDIRERLRALEASDAGLLPSVATKTSTESALISCLNESLKGQLTSSQIEELAMVLLQDDCMDAHDGNVFSVVFLGGSLSVFFRQD